MNLVDLQQIITRINKPYWERHNEKKDCRDKSSLSHSQKDLGNSCLDKSDQSKVFNKIRLGCLQG